MQRLRVVAWPVRWISNPSIFVFQKGPWVDTIPHTKTRMAVPLLQAVCRPSDSPTLIIALPLSIRPPQMPQVRRIASTNGPGSAAESLASHMSSPPTTDARRVPTHCRPHRIPQCVHLSPPPCFSPLIGHIHVSMPDDWAPTHALGLADGNARESEFSPVYNLHATRSYLMSPWDGRTKIRGETVQENGKT